MLSAFVKTLHAKPVFQIFASFCLRVTNDHFFEQAKQSWKHCRIEFFEEFDWEFSLVQNVFDLKRLFSISTTSPLLMKRTIVVYVSTGFSSTSLKTVRQAHSALLQKKKHRKVSTLPKVIRTIRAFLKTNGNFSTVGSLKRHSARKNYHTILAVKFIWSHTPISPKLALGVVKKSFVLRKCRSAPKVVGYVN